MTKFAWPAALAFAAGLPLGGCTLGPDFKQPAPWWSPTTWITPKARPVALVKAPSLPVGEPVDPQWWSVFADPRLVTLETQLADDNLDVRLATVRLAESRASLSVTRADAFPQLNGNTSYTREQQSKKGVLSLFGGGSGGGAASPGAGANGLGGTTGGTPNTGLFNPFDLYQYGFDASWELDLWGRVRRSVEAANAAVAVSEEARRDALVTAQAELARDYMQLRGTQEQARITAENLASSQRSVDLTAERARGGLASDLDVANAAAELATTRSQVPGLQAQIDATENAIALLLGAPPQTLNTMLDAPRAIPPVPPEVPVGLPSDLVRRRPDIRQAEANLHEATANVGVATADFFPRFTLSASAAIQAVQFNQLANWGQANTYSIGPSVTLPIFRGGQLTHTLELRQAQQQEAGLSYQRAVLVALHDVDNALTAYAAEQGRLASLRQAVAQNQRALALARDQYTAGFSSFLDVLTAQRSLLATQLQAAQSTQAISTDLVALYKALGGGWETAYPETPEPVAPVLKAALQP